MAEWQKTLEEIARLGRHGRTRRNDYSNGVPVDWAPSAITNPATGIPFSDASAWEFICELITSGHPFQEQTMNRPKGALAYRTTYELSSGVTVFIKVQLAGEMAFGRSFHISTGAK